jgi:high-affinity nickel-transport protein
LFSATATANHGGTVMALLLALSFMLGMMLTDAANGLWIAGLLRRADANARLASRIMGVTVAMLSLSVAGLGLSRFVLPGAVGWQDGNELLIGMGVIAIVAASFMFARRAQHDLG